MLDLFDIKEEDIDIFENNMFDESIGETEEKSKDRGANES